MKVYEMNGCSYRVKNKILEVNIHDDRVLLGNEFAEVEYFNNFTVGDLLECLHLYMSFHYTHIYNI